MPKVSVYLPDDLYREARARGLPLSELTQHAVQHALLTSWRTDWVDRVRARAPRHRGTVDAAALLDEVRQEFGA